jgi:hypothetical protein
MIITKVNRPENKHLLGQEVKIIKNNVTSGDGKMCHEVETKEGHRFYVEVKHLRESNKSVNEKLEVFRKLHSLGQKDIEKIFSKSHIKEHLFSKYEAKRKSEGVFGNSAFLFTLDEDNARLVLDYIGA